MDADEILLQVFLAFGFAVGGGALSALLQLSHRALCALISLAAGTLLGVTFFAILPESLEVGRWWEVLVALISGYALFYFISKYVHHICPACAASHFDEDAARRFAEIATALVVALAIHSTTDGLAISAGQEADSLSHANRAVNWSLLLALCIHKVPEGFALGALLRGAGYRQSAAVGYVTAVEATTVLGGLLGILFLGKVSAFWLGLIFAHVGGGFLYLAAHALLGEFVKHGKVLVVTSFFVGFALIAAISICLRML